MDDQGNFNDYVTRQLKNNSYMIRRLSDYMSRVKGELKLTVVNMLLWLPLKLNKYLRLRMNC